MDLRGEREDLWVSPSDIRVVVSVYRAELLFVEIRHPKCFILKNFMHGFSIF